MWLRTSKPKTLQVLEGEGEEVIRTMKDENVPTELLKCGGEERVKVLNKFSLKIRKTE